MNDRPSTPPEGLSARAPLLPLSFVEVEPPAELVLVEEPDPEDDGRTGTAVPVADATHDSAAPEGNDLEAAALIVAAPSKLHAWSLCFWLW